LASSSTSAPAGSFNSHPRRPGSVALVSALAVVLLIWSLNYIVGKITLAHIDPLTLASLRAQIVALMYLAIYFARSGRTQPRARDLWTFIALGFFGNAVNQGCFVIGLGHTTSEHSVIIIASGPILILLLASLMRLERLTAAKVLGMAICFAGVVLLETGQGSLTNSPLLIGDLISLAGVLGFSIYALIGKKVARTYDTVSMNTFNAVIGALVFLPLAVRQGIRLDWKAVGWQGWTGLLYMAAFSAVLGYLLFYWLLQHMDVSRVVAINYFQPVVVVLLSIPLLGERPTGRLVASAALVLLGVHLAERVSQ